jgi:predicted TIM-barrel fold metal-dependent hydrolase
VIIEWHTHVYPPEEAAASPLWGGRCPMTVENVLAAHHEAGLAVSVVSNAAHYLRGKDAKDELGAIARWSDYAAEIQDAHRGTLYCLAMATPCGGPAHLKELERAIRELNLKGVLINSSHKGHYPDDDEARGFWELVQDLDIPVMIHPPHVGFGEERMREYRLASSVGRPADLCLALSRLIVHSGGFSAGQDRGFAWRRRHLRGYRPARLCL